MREWLLRFGELRHIGGVLATAQHRTLSDHQQIVKVVQRGIPGSGILKTLPARTKLLQSILPRRVSHATGWSRSAPSPARGESEVKLTRSPQFPNRSPTELECDRFGDP